MRTIAAAILALALVPAWGHEEGAYCAMDKATLNEFKYYNEIYGSNSAEDKPFSRYFDRITSTDYRVRDEEASRAFSHIIALHALVVECWEEHRMHHNPLLEHLGK